MKMTKEKATFMDTTVEAYIELYIFYSNTYDIKYL